MTNLQINSFAPDFELTSSEGRKFKLSDYRGKNIILYFYPKDDTPGCSIEAKNFTNLIFEFKKYNTQIIGISGGSKFSSNKFKQKYCLNFDLLFDENKEVCQLYGVWGKQTIFGITYLGIARTTFFINDLGIINHIWSNVKVSGHADEVLNIIKKLNL